MVMSWKTVAAHIQLREVAVQLAEDVGVISADEEDLVAPQLQVAIEVTGQQFYGANVEAVGLGEEGDGRAEFDFQDGE
jgi:hypothetical protein